MTIQRSLALTALALTLVACGRSNDAGDGNGNTSAGQDTADKNTVELEHSAGPKAASCPAADDNGVINIAPGLTAKVLSKGYGRAATVGDFADTNVWLWLYDEAAEDRHGAFIWESGNDVFQFQLGQGQVIKGWDLGVPCMLEGETRELVVAGDLAYGPSGRGEIPPNATLIFTIELLKLTAPQ